VKHAEVADACHADARQHDPAPLDPLFGPARAGGQRNQHQGRAADQGAQGGKRQMRGIIERQCNQRITRCPKRHDGNRQQSWFGARAQ